MSDATQTSGADATPASNPTQGSSDTLSAGTQEVAYEAFGVRVALKTDVAHALARFREFLPPGSRPCDPATAEQRFELDTDHDEAFRLRFNEDEVLDYQDLELALGLLDMHMTGYIAVHAPERIFVHAGVVAHQGRAIVMPGQSFAGKSSLVAALVRAGATYYSDDFAVLDERGRVHPYPKPLSLRGKNLKQTTHTAESFGGTTGEEPVTPALVVMTTYRAGAEWRPRQLSSGEGVLALLSNTVPARERPAESLQAISRALESAVVIESERDEAEALAPVLFAELERRR